MVSAYLVGMRDFAFTSCLPGIRGPRFDLPGLVTLLCRGEDHVTHRYQSVHHVLIGRPRLTQFNECDTAYYATRLRISTPNRP